jgi:hypothetical protein
MRTCCFALFREVVLMSAELRGNIIRSLRTDEERKFWDEASEEDRERFVTILKADGLGEAMRELKKCVSAQAAAED